MCSSSYATFRTDLSCSMTPSASSCRMQRSVRPHCGRFSMLPSCYGHWPRSVARAGTSVCEATLTASSSNYQDSHHTDGSGPPRPHHLARNPKAVDVTGMSPVLRALVPSQMVPPWQQHDAIGVEAHVFQGVD
jgi:hypothetical protein